MKEKTIKMIADRVAAEFADDVQDNLAIALEETLQTVLKLEKSGLPADEIIKRASALWDGEREEEGAAEQSVEEEEERCSEVEKLFKVREELNKREAEEDPEVSIYIEGEDIDEKDVEAIAQFIARRLKRKTDKVKISVEE